MIAGSFGRGAGMRRRMWIVAAATAATALGGCSASRDKSAAEAGVVRFHEMLDDAHYHDIYAGAAAEFRQSGSEQAAIATLQRVHDRLGAFRSSQQSGWRVNFGTAGNIVRLSYNTQFASGAGAEDFVFRIEGNAPQLVGYHVNSPALNGQAAAAIEPPKPDGAPPQPLVTVPAEPAKPSEPQPAGGK